MELKPKEVFQRIGFSFAISFLVVNLVQLVIIAVLTVIESPLLQSEWLTWVLIVISFYLIGFPLFCGMVKNLPNASKQPPKKLKLIELVEYGCIAYTLTYVFNLLTLVITTAIEALKGSLVPNVGQELVSATAPVGLIICGVILSPIIEELLFRKILLDKIRGYGDKIAITVSAITFGLYHGNLSQAFYAAALGAVLAYVTLKTNRIRYAIILHIFINGMSAIILPAILGDGTQFIRIAVAMAFIFLILILGMVGFVRLIKKLDLKMGDYYIHPNHFFQTVFGNSGMISYFVMSLILILLSIISA